MTKVVIVGGGISGLVLAYRLQQRVPDADIALLEKQATVGGVIRTDEADGFRVEAGPNGFLDNKPAARDLCSALGLHDRLISASEAAGRNRYLCLEGRLHRLPTGLLPFLRSDLLSWRAKLRLLTERFRRRGPANDDESIDAFARRRAGAEVAATLADAFVTGIWAGDPTLLSVRAAFPRLAALEQQHGSVSAGFAAARKQRRAAAAAAGRPVGRASGQMWSFPEGLSTLVHVLGARLRRPPHTGAAVREVRRTPTGWEVHAEGGAPWEADAVALACPAHAQALLLGRLDADLAALIGGIPCNRIAVVALGYRAADVPNRLDGFGYLSPGRARRDLLGVQWCSSIFPGHRAPAGAVLLRALCGGWHRPEMVDWDDDRLAAAARAELRQTLRIEAAPFFRHIVRWDRAIPQYHLGHLDRVARIDERAALLPGLFLGGNAYRGVALPDCVEQASLLAERMAQWLASRGR